jgi:hypothetical protein
MNNDLRYTQLTQLLRPDKILPLSSFAYVAAMHETAVEAALQHPYE